MLSHDGLDDLQVETANLEQVYQHFLSKHEKQHATSLNENYMQNKGEQS